MFIFITFYLLGFNRNKFFITQLLRTFVINLIIWEKFTMGVSWFKNQSRSLIWQNLISNSKEPSGHVQWPVTEFPVVRKKKSNKNGSLGRGNNLRKQWGKETK